jgi:hypothetical protein
MVGGPVSRVDLDAVRLALGNLSGLYAVGPHDLGGGVELTCKLFATLDIAYTNGGAKKRLEASGFNVMAIGQRLHIASPATAAASAEVQPGPWAPGWVEPSDDSEVTT